MSEPSGANELGRRSEILSDYFDEDIDYVAEGLARANAGPATSLDVSPHSARWRPWRC